jgi:hypothetical protein
MICFGEYECEAFDFNIPKDKIVNTYINKDEDELVIELKIKNNDYITVIYIKVIYVL